jgi:hypothetical protein
MNESDPAFGAAFARSLGLFLDAMQFEEPVQVRGQRIIVHVTDDLVVYLDVRAVRREPCRFRGAARRSRLTLVSPSPDDEIG